MDVVDLYVISLLVISILYYFSSTRQIHCVCVCVCVSVRSERKDRKIAVNGFALFPCLVWTKLTERRRLARQCKVEQVYIMPGLTQ
jgi:hypothetical protein